LADIDDGVIAATLGLFPGARFPELVLGVGDLAGTAGWVEPDLDHLPVPFMLAESVQVLRVVVVEEPVLQPR
jgi:hypothetical protein